MKLKYEIALIATAAVMLIGPALLWRRAPRFIREFFVATTSPVNLAIFRVVLFTVVLFSFSIHNVTWFAGLPKELLFPPVGLGGVLKYIPINETLAWYAAVGLTISCLLAIAGLFTRTSIVVSLLLSVYVLGVPQLFGKINHYHHLTWFMLILAVSPCADVLSIDAIFKSWKRADRGLTEPPAASVRYALPLRFVWLLMGVIYFSAGFWKVWTAGLAWAWSDNPRNTLYNKWTELGGWTSSFRIDHNPVLLKSSALFTLAFELSFILLIFFAVVRWLAPIGGLMFHTATNVFMKISFWNLQACYVTFVDWHRLLGAIGRRLFPNDMYVIYDGNCKLCRRTVSSFRVFDLFGRVIYVNALDANAIEALNWLNADALMRDIHVEVGKKTSLGFAAYREWMKRMPLFWFLVPFMSLWPVQVAGKRTYRHIADSRTCAIGDNPRSNSPSAKSVFVVGCVGYLIVFAVVLSTVGKLQSWPIAAYPSFEDLDPPEVRVLTIATRTAEGEASELRPIQRQTLTEMPPERLMALQYRLISSGDRNEQARRLAAFWGLWRREDPALRNYLAVRFYADTISTLPKDRYRSPLRREVLAVAASPYRSADAISSNTPSP